MNKKEIGRQLHQQGYNCCQAVVCAYAEDFGVDKNQAFKMAEAFGRGFGGRQETCGAVAGMGIVLGLASSGGVEAKGKTKISTYNLTNELVERFIAKNGTHICAKLLNENGIHRSCTDLIADCIEILEDYFD